MSDGRNSNVGTGVMADAGLQISSALLVPASCYSFVRVFESADALTPIVLAALVSSALAAALRLLRLPLALAFVVSVAAFGVLALNGLAPDTADYLVLPTDATWEVLRSVWEESIDAFQNERTPVEALDGFIAAAAGGGWIAAFLVDWAALRLRLAFEPVLPPALLFIFSSIVGAGTDRIAATTVFVGGVVLWSVANRSARERTTLWLNADRRRGPNRIAMGSAAFGVIAVLGGLLAGPLIPTADETALVDWRNTGDPSRTVVSPYVNIRSQLVNQRDVPLFQVRTNVETYYRLAGLDKYDDGTWGAEDLKSRREDGALPGLPFGGSAAQADQQFVIQELGGDWIPAAYVPVEIDAELQWILDTSSLIVPEEFGSIEGFEYSVVSTVPNPTVDELRASRAGGSDEIRRRYLELPDDLTERVEAEAASITAGAATDYDRLIALEQYFHQFAYSTSLSPRGDDPIGQFLDERIGFCQQFAGTFALMARALDLPARVAVGFTWGDALGDGLYQVSGRHAHAWPEVFFEGLGWVMFEPTPGRGSPTANYTSAPAGQDSEAGVAPTTSTTVPADDGFEDPSNTVPLEPNEATDSVSTGDASESGGGGLSVDGRLLAVAAVVLLGAIGLPLAQHLRRERRRGRASTPAERIDCAWSEVAEALERHRSELRRESETRLAFVQRLAKRSRYDYLPLVQLGSLATTARYAPGQVTADDAHRAEHAAEQIVDDLRGEHSALRRWRTEADPRRLWRPTGRSLGVTAAATTAPAETETGPDRDPNRQNVLSG